MNITQDVTQRGNGPIPIFNSTIWLLRGHTAAAASRIKYEDRLKTKLRMQPTIMVKCLVLSAEQKEIPNYSVQNQE